MKIVGGLRRYNTWAGNPQGVAEDVTRCVEELHDRGRGGMFYQCPAKRGHGPDGLYCKRHAEQFLDTPIGTYYRTIQYGWEITAIPVYKETEKTITIKEGSRLSATSKQSSYDTYWPTREDAVKHLGARLNRMRAELKSAEREFAKAERGK